MAGSQDLLLTEAVTSALRTGPIDVLDLLDRVRAQLGGPEGPFHVLLHGLVRRGVVKVAGRSARGLAAYGLPGASGGAAGSSASSAPPAGAEADAKVEVTARRVASAVRDPAARARVEADVRAHLARLEAQGRSGAFGAPRAVRHLLRRTDRGRPTVVFARGLGGGMLRFVLHEGPWILAAVVAFLLIRAFLAEVFVIPSSSMEPTLLPTDRVVVFKPGGKSMPRRFEIVTFERGGITYVKRVAGLGGESVAIVGGDVLTRRGSEPFAIAVKPDDVRRALRFPYAAWDLAADAGDWARTVEDGGGSTWRFNGGDLWSAGPDPRPSPGADVRLRDVYVRLEGELPAGGGLVLALAYRPGPDVGNEGPVRLELHVREPGARLLVAVPGGKDPTPAARERPAREVLSPGRLVLELSQVDGVLRAAVGDWRWEVPVRIPFGYVVRPALRVDGAVAGPLRLVLDKDEHYSLAGQLAVPDFDGDDDPTSYALAVPEGHVFLLGDNTYDSRDSRFRKMGPVALDELIGPVRFRIWPPGRIGPVR